MNLHNENTLSWCIQAALDYEHGNIWTSKGPEILNRFIWEALSEGDFTVPKEYFKDSKPEYHVGVGCTRARDAFVIYLQIPCLSYNGIKVEAYRQVEYPDNIYGDNIYRVFKRYSWDINITGVPPEEAAYYVSMNYKPKKCSAAEAVDLLVKFTLGVGKAWWSGIDDTTKRFMMLDMSPSIQAPVAATPIETLELEMV